jgi:hypothetical protein
MTTLQTLVAPARTPRQTRYLSLINGLAAMGCVAAIAPETMLIYWLIPPLASLSTLVPHGVIVAAGTLLALAGALASAFLMIAASHFFTRMRKFSPLRADHAQRAVELALIHPQLEAHRSLVAASGRAFDHHDLDYFEAFELASRQEPTTPDTVLEAEQIRLLSALRGASPLSATLESNALASADKACCHNGNARKALLEIPAATVNPLGKTPTHKA